MQNDARNIGENNVFENYLGSYYKGNYVWGGAMNLAWDELNKNILHEKLQLDTDDEIALQMVEKFNISPFSAKDLDEESYYIKSGYGQNTVDAINRESKKKFPSKSFSDLEIDLTPFDIISYAYFLKEVEYETTFKKDDVLFNGQTVDGFSADNEAQKENIKVINYENDDKFIIKSKLKDKNDELILAKGYDMVNPQEVVSEIKGDNGKCLPINSSDHFKAPKLHLDHYRDYTELIDKNLANKGYEDYFIKKMFENIKFNMDERGARVENEGVIMARFGASMLEKNETKNFILDQPYWVVMKKSNSENPYFILGVNNIELMQLI